MTAARMMPPVILPPRLDHPGRARPGQPRLLDIEQMKMTLALLAGYRPTVSGAVPDPAQPGAGDGAGDAGPAPYCTLCDGPVGIFLGHGAEWRHFRALRGGAGPAEVYDAGHAPMTGWRVPAAALG